jgi:hypothetical protein
MFEKIKTKLNQIKNWIIDKWNHTKEWFKKQWKKIIAILGIGVALAATTQINQPLKNWQYETDQVYAIGIIIDLPDKTSLSSTTQKIERLIKFTEPALFNEGTEDEMTGYVIKNQEGKISSVKTYFAISQRTNQEIRDMIMSNLSPFNFNGGLEFNDNPPKEKMRERLAQLIGEQGGDKIIFLDLSSPIPTEIISKFYDR